MPEGVEVRIITEALHKELQGKPVVTSTIMDTDKMASLLQMGNMDNFGSIAGRTILRVGRIGKYIVFKFKDGYGMILHLVMTGQLHWLRNDVHPWKRDYSWCWEFGTHRLYFRDTRRFAKLWVGDWAELNGMERIQHLGPDMFEVTREVFAQRLWEHRRKQLKTVLLDQKVISGIGNIYGDEISARAGILPTRLLVTLGDHDLMNLYDSMKAVVERSYQVGGSSIKDYMQINGQVGNYSKEFQVFQQKNCRACSSVITRVPFGGRHTHFCTSCQH